MSFKIGDRVVIVRHPTNPSRNGTVTTVLSGLQAHTPCRNSNLAAGTPVHQLDLVPTPEQAADGALIVCMPPAWLRPHDDGSEKSEWTDELLRLCLVKENA